MEMMELQGRKIKIGKTSITVKRDDGKTAGVVQGIRTEETIESRDRFTLWTMLKEDRDLAWGPFVYDRKKFYYLNDVSMLRRREEDLKTYTAKISNSGAGMFEDLCKEIKAAYDAQIARAKRAAKYMTVIDCEVL